MTRIPNPNRPYVASNARQSCPILRIPVNPTWRFGSRSLPRYNTSGRTLTNPIQGITYDKLQTPPATEKWRFREPHQVNYIPTLQPSWISSQPRFNRKPPRGRNPSVSLSTHRRRIGATRTLAPSPTQRRSPHHPAATTGAVVGFQRTPTNQKEPEINDRRFRAAPRQSQQERPV